MNILDSFNVSIEALRLNKVRSALTMLGVIIGVMSVILLVSMGEGARRYIYEELGTLGTNLLIITPGKTATKGGFHPPVAGAVRKLIYDDAIALRKRVGYLTDAVPIIFGTGKIKYHNLSRDTSIVGCTEEYFRVRNLNIEIGSFISSADVDTKRRVVVLGRTVKRELFGDINPLGKMVTLNDARYRVIGVMERKGVALGFDIDDIVFIPTTSAQELFDTDSLFQIVTRVGRAEYLEEAEEQIRNILIKRHNNNEDFTIISQDEMISVMGKILNIMTGVLAGIAGISLLVGGIGIMNIMLVSVKERTKEIGIRKAVGARKRDVMQQFLIEAVSLSLTGGVVGIGVGIGLALLVPRFTFLPTKISLWSVTIAFLFSAAVGIFFGVYPARKAATLDPIQALRYE
jgi:putative ABC transport system permease protein